MIQNKKYIAFQMNHRIDDEDSTFEYQEKDGRDAYFQITRKENEEWVNAAFKQGFYQYTWDMEAPHHEAVFMYLNQGFRPTGQFCPSMSIGDLVYEMETGKWFFCANMSWTEMDIDFPWEIVDADSQNFYVKHTNNRETGLSCGFIQKVPKIWFDRWFREVYDYQYEKCGNHEHCVKCRILNRNGTTMWNEFSIPNAELPSEALKREAERKKMEESMKAEMREDMVSIDDYVSDEDVDDYEAHLMAKIEAQQVKSSIAQTELSNDLYEDIPDSTDEIDWDKEFS